MVWDWDRFLQSFSDRTIENAAGLGGAVQELAADCAMGATEKVGHSMANVPITLGCIVGGGVASIPGMVRSFWESGEQIIEDAKSGEPDRWARACSDGLYRVAIPAAGLYEGGRATFESFRGAVTLPEPFENRAVMNADSPAELPMQMSKGIEKGGGAKPSSPDVSLLPFAKRQKIFVDFFLEEVRRRLKRKPMAMDRKLAEHLSSRLQKTLMRAGTAEEIQACSREAVDTLIESTEKHLRGMDPQVRHFWDLLRSKKTIQRLPMEDLERVRDYLVSSGRILLARTENIKDLLNKPEIVIDAAQLWEVMEHADSLVRVVTREHNAAVVGKSVLVAEIQGLTKPPTPLRVEQGAKALRVFFDQADETTKRDFVRSTHMQQKEWVTQFLIAKGLL